jgi:hypothetical protein
MPLLGAKEENIPTLLKRVGQPITWSYSTADCQQTYDELTARVVTFTSPPTAHMYGIKAVCQDLYGNSISIVQLSNWAKNASSGWRPWAEMLPLLSAFRSALRCSVGLERAIAQRMAERWWKANRRSGEAWSALGLKRATSWR